MKLEEFHPDPFSISDFENNIGNWIKKIGGEHLISCVTKTYPEKPLLPMEEDIVANSLPARRAEFAAGRYCGRKALNQLGYQNLPIMKGDKGEPVWPESIVGSITHDHEIAIAVISTRQTTAALGIDLLALNSNIDSSATQLISNQSELEDIRLMLSQNYVNASRNNFIDPLLLIFSAKESAIKRVSPAIDYYLDFRDIKIVSEDNNIQTFFPNLNLSLEVHWQIFNNMIFTISYSNTADSLVSTDTNDLKIN